MRDRATSGDKKDCAFNGDINTFFSRAHTHTYNFEVGVLFSVFIFLSRKTGESGALPKSCCCFFSP